MKKYKINFTEYQHDIFNTLEFNGDKKRKLMSVYSYLIKYSNTDLLVTKSLNKLHTMYLRYHSKLSLSYFKKLTTLLIDMELVEKINNCLYIVAKKVAKKVAEENVDKPLENSELGQDSFLPNSPSYNYNYYTDTNIVKMMKEYYVGITGRKNATKKDLKDIAKCLISIKRANALVQTIVFNKIENSQTTINLRGAVQYVNEIIVEKMEEVNSISLRQYDEYYNSDYFDEETLCYNLY